MVFLLQPSLRHLCCFFVNCCICWALDVLFCRVGKGFIVIIRLFFCWLGRSKCSSHDSSSAKDTEFSSINLKPNFNLNSRSWGILCIEYFWSFRCSRYIIQEFVSNVNHMKNKPDSPLTSSRPYRANRYHSVRQINAYLPQLEVAKLSPNTF